jgi:hypothetical protein
LIAHSDQGYFPWKGLKDQPQIGEGKARLGKPFLSGKVKLCLVLVSPDSFSRMETLTMAWFSGKDYPEVMTGKCRWESQVIPGLFGWILP